MTKSKKANTKRESKSKNSFLGKVNQKTSNKLASNFNSGKWSIIEHRSFIIGILLYGNGWDDIQKLVKTRNIPQALSHCQKFFLKLRKIKFFAGDFYSVKKLKEFFRTKKNEEKLILIENLIKAYFKEYELKYFTKFIDNSNLDLNFIKNNKHYSNYYNNNYKNNNPENYFNAYENKIDCDEFCNYSIKSESETNNILKENSNENFLLSLIKDEANLFCSENLVTKQQNKNEVSDYKTNFACFDLKFSKENRNSNSWVNDKHNANNSTWRLHNIEKFLNFCEKGIFSKSTKKNNEHYIRNNENNGFFINQNEQFSKSVNDSKKSFDFNMLKKDLEVNEFSSAAGLLNVNFESLKSSNISKSKFFYLFLFCYQLHFCKFLFS